MFRLCRLPSVLRMIVASSAAMFALTSNASPQAAGDLNGDGRDDVVVGVEGKKVGTQAAAGAAHVIFSTNSGLRFGDDMLIDQDIADSADEAEAGDRFGRVVAIGDFNDDGFDDLAVGVPLEDVAGQSNAGAVHVFYGSASGPTSDDNQFWSEESSGLADNADANDFFGGGLAVGDFDDDGFDDLAIGVPGESLGDLQDTAGVVYVLFGSNSGLSSTGYLLINQDAGTILDVSEAGDRFGAALASGDFDGDGFDDLAVGVPGESIGTIQRAGGVNVIHGSAIGLVSAGNQFWSQNTTNIDDVSEVNDAFGQAITAGDFNGDDRDDLAIGVPNENVGGPNRAGGVNVLLGSINGLVSATDKFFSQATPGIADASEANDRFGFALASGDFNSDGFDDLVIGVPNESIGANLSAGAVHVLYGSGTGLAVGGSQLWRQGASGMKDNSEAGDAFGEALCTGDFNNDGFDDLCVGVPLEDVVAKTDAGAIHVIYGSSLGLRGTGNQFITQDTQNAEGVAKQADRFGGQMMDLF